MRRLPPLLEERPPRVRALMVVGGPLVSGFLTGVTLGISEAAWLVANVLAVLGGIAVGFDHAGAAAGARRGVIGGCLFGLALVSADALVVGDRVASLPHPAILLVVVTTTVGSALGAAGGALRARAIARRRAAEALEPEAAG